MMNDRARKILDTLYLWATEPNGIRNINIRGGYDYAQSDALTMIISLKEAVNNPTGAKNPTSEEVDEAIVWMESLKDWYKESGEAEQNKETVRSFNLAIKALKRMEPEKEG